MRPQRQTHDIQTRDAGRLVAAVDVGRHAIDQFAQARVIAMRAFSGEPIGKLAEIVTLDAFEAVGSGTITHQRRLQRQFHRHADRLQDGTDAESRLLAASARLDVAICQSSNSAPVRARNSSRP
jgi:hypothetical protein